ncbi:MAG: hypothetical protein JKY94_02915 [Rhodobacteraceae bacterium]|nr:hypothetical protein [Paracoccaceae bacterium]
MIQLPTLMLIVGGMMTLMVVYLGRSFWLSLEKGMGFATHSIDGLPQVMMNRYFVIAMMIGGSLIYRRPKVVAFFFAVTGVTPPHDAWIYRRFGASYKKHLIPAAFSAVIAVWTWTIYLNGGAT